MINKLYKIKEKEKWKDVSVSRAEGRVFTVAIGSERRRLEPLMAKPPLYTFLVDGKQILELEIHAQNENDIAVNYGHFPYSFHLLDHAHLALEEAAQKAGVSGGVLKAPMPGKVVEIKVKVGDAVTSGQPLAVVEAMKMQNELGAPGTGTVVQVLVAVGQTVESGAVLIRIEGDRPEREKK